jgi:hypothetical protein
LILYDSSGLTEFTTTSLAVTDTADYHYLGMAADRDGLITICLDGVTETFAAARPGNLDNDGDLFIGRYSLSAGSFFTGRIDLVKIHKGRALSATELQFNHQVILGEQNGSAYPEVGNGLGQYWAFMRLAQYHFHSGDANAWAVLDNWLNWLTTHGVEETT